MLCLNSCNGNKNGATQDNGEIDSAAVTENGSKEEKLPYEIKDNLIYNESVPVIVDFYADWCGPCKQYAPVFHNVAEKFKDSICFVSLDSEQYPELCKTYKISAIPTTVFLLPGGGVLGIETGVLTEQQLEMYARQLLETADGANMSL